jgi:PadR family transcriptional regulator, regulatory protein PadR
MDHNYILRGTLDLLLLRALAAGPKHGFGVARWVELVTGDVLNVGEGTLYPALHRLEERGLVVCHWALTENRRRAKYYSLTATGFEALASETAFWRRYATAIFAALDSPPASA